MTKYSIKSYEDFQATDDDSIASEPEATPFEVMKIAAGEWNRMSSVLKKAWKDRCCAVNQLPIRGVFDCVPIDLRENLNGHAIQCLTFEYDRFCSSMSQALKSRTRIPDTVKWKSFGNEKFELGSQIFRSFYFNHLLKLTIFGDWCSFSKLAPYEIVHKSRMTKVIHVSSKHRMEEIFTLNGVCPFTCCDNKKNRIYCCGGKVSVQELSSSREGIGIVQSEDGFGNIKVLLEIGESITIKKPLYVAGDGTWDYNHSVNDEYKIIQYDPIRMRIIKTGNCSLVMNCFILSADASNMIIIP